jgi:hypothetical protein
MPLSLESLDSDVLALIFREIYYEPAAVGSEWVRHLIPLSSVSRQLRRKVLPTIFQKFIWQPHKRGGKFLPESLLHYVW